MTVFDIETDGLLEEATKIHVLSWMGKDGVVHHTHDQFQMALLLTQAETLVCLLYTSPSPRDGLLSRMPSSA